MGWVKVQLWQTLRSLGRAPLFTAVTLLTLAVGIGANTAIFSVVNGILLKPLPYPHPEDLVAVWLAAPGLNIKDLNLGPAHYFIFREQNRTFQDIGLYMGSTVNVTGSGQPEQAPGLMVTDGLLPVIGATPLLGRSFTQADDQPGSPDTAMLTYGYWQRKFGSDHSVVGKVITVDGAPHEIVGVMRQDFSFAGPNLALLRFVRSFNDVVRHQVCGLAVSPQLLETLCSCCTFDPLPSSNLAAKHEGASEIERL